MVHKKKKSNLSLLKVGYLLLFISTLILIVFQILKIYKNEKQITKSPQGSEKEQESFDISDSESTIWSKYENEEFFIKFSYPYLLHKVEYDETGDYDYFIVFEENQFSKEKGVAFGVSSDGLEKEVGRIKKSVSKEGKSKLIKDEKNEFRNFPSRLLEYEPENKSLEVRSFFVFERGDYTYSFSTVPQQMQRLIGSIEFTN